MEEFKIGNMFFTETEPIGFVGEIKKIIGDEVWYFDNKYVLRCRNKYDMVSDTIFIDYLNKDNK